ncbi:D-amino-acid oxidase [Mycobacterium sp. 012931]|nr:D-amino-acid oxidase [Mycobacterium sp. 012931]
MTPGDRPRVVVIGAGVSGWTTAMVLAKRGWQVVVAADGFGIDAVSSASGAMWEWPPSRCGRYHDQAVLARYAGWAMRSYLRFTQLASDPGTGVGLRPAVYYFGRRIEDDPIEFAKMSEVKRFVPGFVHDPALIDRHGVNRDSGVIDVYSYLAPTIDTDWYLAWPGLAWPGLACSRGQECGRLRRPPTDLRPADQSGKSAADRISCRIDHQLRGTGRARAGRGHDRGSAPRRAAAGAAGTYRDLAGNRSSRGGKRCRYRPAEPDLDRASRIGSAGAGRARRAGPIPHRIEPG